VATILEDMDVDHMAAEKVPLRKAPDKKSASEKGPRQCRHYGRSNHISEKCWEKFGRLEWAQLSDSGSPAPCGTSQSSSYAIPGSFMVVLSQEYDRLRQLVFSQNDLSPTLHLLQVCTPILLLLKSPGY